MIRTRAPLVLGVLVSSVLASAPVQASKPRPQAKNAGPDRGAVTVPRATEAETERRQAIVRQLAGRWVAPAHRGKASDGAGYEDGAATLVLTPSGDGLVGIFVASVKYLDDGQRDELQVEIFVDVDGGALAARLISGRVLLNGQLAPNQRVDLPAFMFNAPTGEIGVKIEYGDEGGMTRILSRESANSKFKSQNSKEGAARKQGLFSTSEF